MSQNSTENRHPNHIRLGIHYFPDDRHYRESDLNTWIPELKKLGMGWVVLIAPLSHAIPETFISGLLSAGIEPILHVPHPVSPVSNLECRLLFETYARWGVHYLLIFDRPNVRSSWPPTAWVQTDLVECFLDIYLPLALQILEAGLIPVFPPLEPGGDYWDTAFLRDALQGLSRRGQGRLLNNLVLSAYANVFPLDRPLTWGVGGPERWPGSRPYNTPPDQEDHQGFHIFDWYTAICQAITGKSMPLILLGVGDKKYMPFGEDPTEIDQEFNRRMTTIAQLMSQPANEEVTTIQTISGQFDPVPPNVISCNYVVFSSSPEAEQSHSEEQQSERLMTQSLQDVFKQPASFSSTNHIQAKSKEPQTNHSIIEHYLLLPLYEWGVADWQLNVIQPFVTKHHPTIGFSLEEAAHAKKVTFFGNPSDFSVNDLIALQTAGCIVDCLSGDGTSIAPYLPTDKLE